MAIWEDCHCVWNQKTTNFRDKRFLFCISGIFIVKNANWVIILKYIIINWCVTYYEKINISYCGKFVMNFDFIFGDGVSGMAGYSLILILAALASKQYSVKRFISRFAVNVRAQCYLDENSYHVFRHLDIRISGA